MAWIKVHQTLKDHRKVLQAADELEIETAHMLGLIVSFWLWALDNAPAGSLAGISHRMIARAAQWERSPEPFVSALISAGLLKDTPDGLEINDWYEYAGKLIDQREAEKNRSKRRRAAAAASQPDDRRTTDKRPPDDRQTTAGRVEKSRLDKSRVDKTREEKTVTPPDGSPAPPTEQTPHKEIVEMYHDICKSYPKLRNVSDNRKKAIAARWKEYKHDLEIFRELFEKAEASSFLKGRNKKNWTADFNWLMNSENMAKVLEGKYTDEIENGQAHGVYSERPEQQRQAAGGNAFLSLLGGGA